MMFAISLRARTQLTHLSSVQLSTFSKSSSSPSPCSPCAPLSSSQSQTQTPLQRKATHLTLYSRPFSTGKGIGGFAAPSVAGSGYDFFKSENHFSTVADSLLDSFQDTFDDLDDNSPEFGIENSYSSGVMNIKMGDAGTWVLNKQTPNKQIWWSSPRSGPKRFEFCGVNKEWVNSRDAEEKLVELMIKEVQEVTGEVVVIELEEVN